jgi:hypothetical protein
VAIELDDWDKDFLARPHTPEEWRRECESALLRCAAYSARIDRLEAELDRVRWRDVQRCAYPKCLDGGGRCHAMFKGECSGPNQRRTTI